MTFITRSALALFLMFSDLRADDTMQVLGVHQVGVVGDSTPAASPESGGPRIVIPEHLVNIKRVQEVVREATRLYSQLHGARITVLGNADEWFNPWLVIHPPGPGPGEAVIHLHFVGDVDPNKPPGAATLEQLILKGWSREPSVIYFIPEGNRGIGGGRARWPTTIDLEAMESMAREQGALGGNVRRRLVTAHSGGVHGVLSLLRYSRPVTLTVDRIVLMDTPMQEIIEHLQVWSQVPAPPITHVYGRQPGWRSPTVAEALRLRIEPPPTGPFSADPAARKLQYADRWRRHYQALDESFAEYYR